MLVALLAGAMAISIYGQIHHARLAGGFFSQRMAVLFNAMTSGALLMMALLVAAGFLITPGSGQTSEDRHRHRRAAGDPGPGA